MEIEVETRQNTRDISALAINVTRLTTLVESGEKRHAEDRQTMRDIFDGLKTLNDKIGGVTAMQDKIAELSSQLGGIKHDIKNLDSVMQGLPMVKKDVVENEKAIAAHDTRLDALELWKNKHDGATGAVKVFIHVLWAVFGSGVTAMCFYFLSDFFQHSSAYQRVETEQHYAK